MSYLIRFYRQKPHPIAHYVHKINGVTGALCSHTPKPTVGQQSRNGEWELLETLPENVRLCHICQKVKHKLDNPLPARVEQELKMLARWDTRAAAMQREKMVAFYLQKRMARR
ncbi:MAG: hypothetical protein GY803_12465 [Chloroflexi bacterium]|nr:hypothetical protein [Chloroflexota bacterium]